MTVPYYASYTAFLTLIAVIGLLGQAGAAPVKITATDVAHFTVYHSPQTPGYTCWAGCWLMPDETLMLSFHQATGPLSGRPHARPDVLHALSWPPQGNFGYDMTGTIQQIIHLASTDGSHTWQQIATEPYHSPMNGCTCEAETALPDGTVVRGVWGQYLPFYDVPQTGYVQRSTDRGQTWTAPSPVMDPDRFIVFPKRLRLLRDGRLVLTGGFSPLGPDIKTRYDWFKGMRMAMWLSDDGGHTWPAPVVVLPDMSNEETDFAELPDGRLLFVSRVDGAPHPRWQSLLEPAGDSYHLISYEPAPFPHSGHPEMLAAREGVALHLATTGIHWTADAGQTWHDLGIGGTGYYPRSVQLPDGRIFCVCHRGGDNPYDGSVDQEIQAMTFRLQAE